MLGLMVFAAALFSQKLVETGVIALVASAIGLLLSCPLCEVLGGSETPIRIGLSACGFAFLLIVAGAILKVWGL